MTYNNKPTLKDRRTRILLLVTGILIYSAFVYGSGMEAEIRKAKAVNEQRKLAAQDYRDAQRKLRLRIALVEQLEARRQVALALDALDKRNFGTAQANIVRAARLVDQAQVSGTNGPDLAEAKDALKKTNLVATADIGAQREALTAIAAQMDRAFGTYTDTFLDASIKDDTAHPIVPPTMNDVPSMPGSNKGADLVNGQDYPK